ncbi:MAG TPA: DUF2752 domain-containing protein [Polyangiaceae bacterium]|nr:DUF2752 domain-containing protein [Polyangiaceae bacterium]
MERLARGSKFVDRGVLGRAAIALGIGGAFALIVATHFPLCPMAGVFGVPCPGCGLTRATLALLHGDVRRALSLHPLVFAISPLFAWLSASAAFTYVRGPRPSANFKPWLASRAASVLLLVLLVATVSVWAMRFLGYFGGPAPVETFRSWLHSMRATSN